MSFSLNKFGYPSVDVVVLLLDDLCKSLKFSNFVVIVGRAFASGYGVDADIPITNLLNCIKFKMTAHHTNVLSNLIGANLKYIFDNDFYSFFSILDFFFFLDSSFSLKWFSFAQNDNDKLSLSWYSFQKMIFSNMINRFAVFNWYEQIHFEGISLNKRTTR